MAAEAALFSLVVKLLSTIAEPSFKKPYEKAQSTWKARKELENLRRTIKTIQAVVLDAEPKYTDSALVRNWVERVSGILHDAEYLFDEVAIADLLEQQMEGNKYVKKISPPRRQHFYVYFYFYVNRSQYRLLLAMIWYTQSAGRILRLEEQKAHLEGFLRDSKPVITNEVQWIIAYALRDSNPVWMDETRKSYLNTYQ